MSLFLMCATVATASCSEVAYYTTCPCHKSVRIDMHGKNKERKCKKEMTVGPDVSESLVIRMLAWWLSNGSCAEINFLAPPYQLKGSNSWVGESLKSWLLTSYITFQMFLSSTIAQCLGFKLVQRDGETDEDLRKRHVSMVQGSEAKAVTHYEWHCKNWQWWNIFIDSDSQQPAALKPVCSVAAMIATIIKTSTVNNFYRLFG